MCSARKALIIWALIMLGIIVVAMFGSNIPQPTAPVQIRHGYHFPRKPYINYVRGRGYAINRTRYG